MARSDNLFAQGDLSAAFRGQEEKLAEAARAIPADHALARSAEELAAELVEQVRIEPLQVDWEGMTASYRDREVDVSRDPMRFIHDRSRPFMMPGTEITYHIPFRGEADLFKLRPSRFTLNPPIAEIGGGEVLISRSAPAPVPESLKNELDRTVTSIREYVGTINADVAGFNRDLPAKALAAANARRDKVLADKALAATLGVPLQRREDATPTYATPAVQRKVVAATTPRAGTRAEAPEPVVNAEEYERILEIVRGMAQVLERSPKTFAGMDEESVRTHFLVQLNGQYQGGATGETFNFEGKTDIMVRDRGRNVFIAECKFWSGPKQLTDTIDQILGYASWRDTKTAIFIFNRTKDLSKVLAQISPAVSAHPNFVREIPYGGETEFRFVLHHRDDAARELTLTILVFEVPS